MQIKETIERDTARLAFSGDLLGETDGDAIRRKFHDLVEGEVRRAVIDLGGVRHINSAGLGSLIAALITMRKSGGDIRLARVGHNVQNIFVVTRLVQIFDTHETVEEAVKAFRDTGTAAPPR
jgi:anti-sigma B factor antagonist